MKVLALTLQSSDGGNAGESSTTEHCCANILTDSDSIYNTTKVKNVTLVLKHSLDSVAVLQHLHVRGPSSKEPGSSTKPLKNGIVFACKTTPDLHRLEIFNDCLSADEFQAKLREDRQVHEADPIQGIYYSLSDTPGATTDIHVRPPGFPGRFFVVKLLGSYGGTFISTEYIRLSGTVNMGHYRLTHAPRPVKTTKRDISKPKMQAIGIQFFASVVAQKPVCRSSGRALAAATKMLRAMPCNALFPEWSPFVVPSNTKLTLHAKYAFASDSKSNTLANALKGDTKTWNTNVVKSGRSFFGVQLTAEQKSTKEISRVELEWDQSRLPGMVVLEAAHVTDTLRKKYDVTKMDKPANCGPHFSKSRPALNWTTLRVLNDPDLIKTGVMDIPVGYSLDKSGHVLLRVRLEGFHASNSTRQHGFKQFTIMHRQKSAQHPVGGLGRCASRVLQDWFTRCASIPELRSAAIDGLSALSLATGSLSCALLLAQEMLRGGGSAPPNSSTNSLTNFSFVDDAAKASERKEFVSFLNTVRTTSSETENSSGTLTTKSSVSFDPSTASDPAMQFSENDMYVKTLTGNYCSVCTTVGVSHGKAEWEMFLAEDTTSQCTCFGAATQPITSHSYEHSPEMWMLRAYNGYLYNRGNRESRTLAKVKKGDTIKMLLDMDVGTLTVFVNDDDHGVAFSNMNQFGTVFPCVAFYSSNRAVRFLSFRGPASGDSVPTVPCATLTPLEPSVGRGSFCCSGRLGYKDKDSKEGPQGRLARVQGKSAPEALSMHPPTNGTASVCYDLAGEYTTFDGAVALDDSAAGSLNSPVLFRVKVDDKLLWESKPVTTIKQIQEMGVSVVGGKKLRLEVSCEGDSKGARALWTHASLTRESQYSVWFRKMFYTPESNNLEPKLCLATKSNTDAAAANPSYRNVKQITGQLADLANQRVREMCWVPIRNPQEDATDKQLLHACCCIEVSKENFERILSLLYQLFPQLEELVRADVAPQAKGNRSVVCFETKVDASTHEGVEDDVDTTEGTAKANNDTDTHEGVKHNVDAPDGAAVVKDQTNAPEGSDSASPCSSGDVSVCVCEEVAADLLVVLAANVQRLRLSKVNSAHLGLQSSVRDGPASLLMRLFCSLWRLANSNQLTQRVRQAAIEALHLGQIVWHPTYLRAYHATLASVAGSTVVEFQVHWPKFRGGEEADGRYERAILLLQSMCRKVKGVECRFIGQWMAAAYLMMHVPNGEMLSFLTQGIAPSLRRAGFPHWSLGTEQEIALLVEPMAAIDRKRRLHMEPNAGIIRVYTEAGASFSSVCETSRTFLRNFSPAHSKSGD